MSPQRAKDAATRNGRELELKYAVLDLVAARRSLDGDVIAGFQAGPWRSVEMVDQYVDTAGGALAQAGYGARLRRIGGRTWLTVKGTPRRAAARRERERGLHERSELEAPAKRSLDPRRWPDSAARAVVERVAGSERLRTLFELHQRREERELARGGSVVATLSLDAVAVRRLGRQLGAFITLEVESADPVAPRARERLAEIAARLEKNAALRREPHSKEEIARLIVDRWLESRHAVKPPRRPGIASDDLLAEAGRKVLRMHLLRMLAAEPGARAGEDVEAVHKMRVATRRMRAAWRVFSGAFRPRFQRRFVDELRSVARALGAVRDMDVQIERLAAYGQGLDGASRDALAPLADEWQRRRRAANAELAELFESAAYERFRSDYRSFVEGYTPDMAAGKAPRLRDVAGGRIWRAYERLRAGEASPQSADAPALHALRIDGKRLRYTLEFLHEILPPDAERLIGDVTELQDHLGLLNDAQVAADTTREWLSANGKRLSDRQRQAVAGYAEASTAEVARLREAFEPVWRRLTGHQFSRRLARAVGAV